MGHFCTRIASRFLSSSPTQTSLCTAPSMAPVPYRGRPTTQGKLVATSDVAKPQRQEWLPGSTTMAMTPWRL